MRSEATLEALVGRLPLQDVFDAAMPDPHGRLHLGPEDVHHTVPQRA